jgi:hypothetical protein
VAPVVSELWGAPSTGTSAAVQPAGSVQGSGPLDLFQETRPDVQRLFGNRA